MVVPREFATETNWKIERARSSAGVGVVSGSVVSGALEGGG